MSTDKIVLKRGELFALLDGGGDAPRDSGHGFGFFRRDTRYVDSWGLCLNGVAPALLQAEVAADALSCSVVLANRAMANLEASDDIAADLLAIHRSLTLGDEGVVETVEIQSYAVVPLALRLERQIGSRFNDIFEVRGMLRSGRGQALPPQLDAQRQTLILSYRGLNEALYQAVISIDHPALPLEVKHQRAVLAHQLQIAAKGRLSLRYEMKFSESGSRSALAPGPAAAAQDRHRLPAGAVAAKLQVPEIDTNCPRLNLAFATAAADLGSLITWRSGALYPDAGIPWYCAPFGRDGVVTAYQMLPWSPQVAEGVLSYVFAHLGTKVDHYTDEEPGKVFHELRCGEMAQQREVPFIPYYGSVDATPLALVLLGEYVEWTKQTGQLRRWWPAAKSALAWVRANIAASPFGFLTYQAKRGSGLHNQGWKDSHDAVSHADGRLAPPPIALCEVQGYAYRALHAMSGLARLIEQDAAEAGLWAAEAEALRERFDRRFWDEPRQLAVLALDGEGQPCRVASSNQGHLLWSRLVDDAKGAAIVRSLRSEALYSGHGIRTLATGEVRFNPLSYHNGSVWPHDNSLIAAGLSSYGHYEALEELAGALFDVARQARDCRLPELFCGFARGTRQSPIPYNVACVPQAWAAGALFLIVKALLGLHLDGDELRFKTPRLPPGIDYLQLRRLPTPLGEVDLVVHRGPAGCVVEQ